MIPQDRIDAIARETVCNAMEHGDLREYEGDEYGDIVFIVKRAMDTLLHEIKAEFDATIATEFAWLDPDYNPPRDTEQN